MSDLAEFLLARITEDEELAQQAATKPWRLDGGFSITVDAGSALAVGQHMMRWDPARVLAECQAKRRIVSMASSRDGYGDQLILQYLALPYSDHADYRDEWRP